MKINLHLVALSFTLLSIQTLQAQQGILKDFDTFFKLYVGLGKVKYNQIQYNRDLIETLVDRIGEQSLSGQSDDFKVAFYINAYNLLTIYQIVENYPSIKSVMDIPSFFKGRRFRVARETMTLDQLEFQYLFAIRKDFRYHFALVCGAQSCPLLYHQAYTAQDLDQQLTTRTRVMFNLEEYVNDVNGEVQLSKVFEWYRADFEKEKPLLEAINDFRDIPINPGKAIKFIDYNWELNVTQ